MGPSGLTEPGVFNSVVSVTLNFAVSCPCSCLTPSQASCQVSTVDAMPMASCNGAASTDLLQLGATANQAAVIISVFMKQLANTTP